MSDRFAHLHVHTEFSILDGASKLDALIKKAVEDGMTHLGITDHGNMYGVVEFYMKCKAAGIVPIIGTELYQAHEFVDERPTRKGKSTEDDGGGESEKGRKMYYHLTALAENNEGYKNLVKLSSRAFSEGYYYKPRTDWEMLADHAKGMIVTSGCLGGQVNQALMKGDYQGGLQIAGRLQDIYGKDNFFIELQDHGIPEQHQTNPELVKISRTLGAGLLLTNDSHYTNQCDAESHDALLCVQTNALISDTNRFKFSGDQHYLKSPAEMRALFPELPEASDNTLAIAERCNVTLDFDTMHLPEYDVAADGFNGTSKEYLRHLTMEGAKKRWGDNYPKKVQDQLDFELKVMDDMGFNSYFLITWDLIRYARTQNIAIGPGRGCLTADTLVSTPSGYIPLPDMKRGDMVLTHTGEIKKVLNSQRYECDENLLELTAWGGAKPVKMTKDHKVWVSKAVLNPLFKKDSTKRWLETNESEMSAPQWVEAADVVVGDLVSVPRLVSPGLETGDKVIDLASFIKTTKFPERYTIKHDYIYESVPRNTPYPHSVREVSALSGIPRNVLKNVLNGKDLSQSVMKLEEYLKSCGMTLNEWSEHLEAHSNIENKLNRYIHLDSDQFLEFIGIFTGDGWLRNGRSGIGLCDQYSKGTKLGSFFEELFGMHPKPYIHKEKDLIQWNFESNLIYAFMQSIFNEHEYTSQTKHLPAFTASLTVAQKMIVLKGLWASDGSDTANPSMNQWHGAKYTTSSMKLAKQVRELLWSCGKIASLGVDSRKDSRPEFRNVSESYYVKTTRGFRDPKPFYAIVSETHIWTRIRSIEEVESEPVYDIEVEGNHSYVTSSFAVHNSAAGSAVAYALEIVSLDPIKYDLLFERFLNPSRTSMPDIDIDMEARGRETMIKYTVFKYGEDRVAQIITYSQVKGKSAIRDAARVLGFPPFMGDKLSKLMPPMIAGRDTPLWACFDEADKYAAGFAAAKEMRKTVKASADFTKIIDIALGLEGARRGTGIHAAAVVIGDGPITDVIPTKHNPDPKAKDNKGPLHTQYDMQYIEALGYLKMDYLGLNTLDIIMDCLAFMKTNHGVTLDMYDIPIDDPGTFQMLADGNSVGVFQLESGGMQDLLKRLKPTSFEDIGALVALYRPGPMGTGMHNEYADRKNGRKKVTYLHEDEKSILEVTYGLCVSEGQTVLTTNGPLPIEKVAVGDRVYGEKGKVGKVTNSAFTGMKPEMSIRASNGREILCSENHPIFTNKGYVEARNLDPEIHLLATPKELQKNEVNQGVTDNDEAFVLAAFIAEGSLPSSRSHSVCNNDIEFLDQFEKSVHARFENIKTTRYFNTRAWYCRVSKKDRYEGGWHSRNEIKTFIKEIGLEGTTSATKFIPAKVFEYSLESKRVFLGAYLSGDGHLGANGVIQIRTISKMVADGLHDLLITLGIYSKVNKDSEAFTVFILDNSAFEKQILPHVILSKASNFVNRPNKGSWADFSMRDDWIESGLSQRDYASSVSISKSQISPGYIESHPFPPESVAERAGYSNEYVWHRIKEVALSGNVARMYDLEVENIHSFLVSSMVVHNCIFQEQVMEIAQKFAGYSLAEADNFRRSMGKKKRDVIQAEKKTFVQGFIDNGYTGKLGQDWFEIIEPFADYAFNKSHAYAYGLISCWAAWLKHNYPSEFMAAQLVSAETASDAVKKMGILLRECKRMGIEILPPDVNVSGAHFTPTVEGIVFGLASVKSIGAGSVATLIEERDAKGPFKDMFDVIERVPTSGGLKKNHYENLIKTGAFGGLQQSALNVIEDALESEKNSKALIKKTGMTSSLFDQEDADTGYDRWDSYRERMRDDAAPVDVQSWEKSLLGIWVSSHPLDGYEEDVAELSSVDSVDVDDLAEDSIIVIMGVIENLEIKITKRTGKQMAILQVSDFVGGYECVVFPGSYDSFSDVIKQDAIVVIQGKVQDKGESKNVIVEAIESFDVYDSEYSANFTLAKVEDSATLSLFVKNETLYKLVEERIQIVVGRHPGNSPVEIIFGTGAVVSMDDRFKVDVSPEFISEMGRMFGKYILEP